MIFKKCIVFFMFFVLIIIFTGCSSNKYTEEEILKIAAEKIEKTYLNNEKYDFQSFDVYPVYSQDDELEYILVEFNPSGYLYLKIDIYGTFFPKLKLTRNVNNISENTWYKYQCVDGEKVKETDSSGKAILYNISQFKEGDCLKEKKYLIDLGDGDYIPAVRVEDKFLNLVSMTYFVYNGESNTGYNGTTVFNKSGFEAIRLYFIDHMGRDL